jgi:hypothetical protein
MIFTGDIAWFVPPTSRYGLSRVSSKELTNSDFTFMCKIKVDWNKMTENTMTQEAGIMIKNGKHLGISIAKTGDNFRIIKGEAWTKTDNPEVDEINQIILPVNDFKNSRDISEEELNITFSCDIINKKLRLIVNNIVNIIDLKGDLIDYVASWLWIGCSNPLDSCPREHQHFFTGDIKFIAVAQKYLSTDEITLVYNKMDKPEHKIIGTYDFIESTPYKVLDTSDNGNNLIKYDKTWMDNE